MVRVLGSLLAVLCVFTAAADVQLRAVRIDEATPWSTWADFNGDGLDDLLSRNFEILWNAGGRFAAPVAVPALAQYAGTAYAASITADFNGDKFADLLLRSGKAGVPDVLVLGDGSGHFREQPLPAPEHGRIIAAADVTNDGLADFIAHKSGALTLLRNDGNAVFSVHQVLTWSERHWPEVAVGDMSGDGFADVAVPGETSVYFYFGSATGAFSGPHRRFTRTPLRNIRVGDVNADGRADLSFVHGFDSISVPTALMGDGAGRFPAAARYEVPYEELNDYAVNDSVDLTVGDFVLGGANEIAYGRRDTVHLFAASAGGEMRRIGSVRVDAVSRSPEFVNVTVRRASFRRPGGHDLIAEGYSMDVRSNPPRRVWLIEADGSVPPAQQTAAPRRARAIGRTDAVSGEHHIVLDSSSCPFALSTLTLHQEGMFVDASLTNVVRGADAVYVNGALYIDFTIVENGVTRQMHGKLRPVPNGFSGMLFENASACGGAARHRVTLVRGH